MEQLTDKLCAASMPNICDRFWSAPLQLGFGSKFRLLDQGDRDLGQVYDLRGH